MRAWFNSGEAMDQLIRVKTDLATARKNVITFASHLACHRRDVANR